MSALDSLPETGVKPHDGRLKNLKDAWLTRVSHNAATLEYLEDETINGVFIGFCLGMGFSLAEAHWCQCSGEFRIAELFN
jgi:hypothetical protein